MPRTSRSLHAKRRLVWLGTVVALLAIAGGWVMAASFQVSQGNTESGGGAEHPTSSLTYWTELSVGVGSQVTPLPATLSTSAATPTTLAAAATSYAINTPTANDIVHFWKFTEASGAPVSTELELQFTVSTGSTPVVTTTTAYIETQATSPTAAVTFEFIYDLGSPTSATPIVLNSVTEISQQCAAVGSCP